MQFLLGVDEAGRGPLAGPVAVGMVRVSLDFDWTLIEGVGDSKKVTPKNREAIFRRAKELKKEGKLDFVVLLGSSKDIDKKGIAVVIRSCIENSLKKLKVKPEDSFVKLDGALRAPRVEARTHRFHDWQRIRRPHYPHRPVAYRPHPALQPRDLHRRVRPDP